MMNYEPKDFWIPLEQIRARQAQKRDGQRKPRRPRLWVKYDYETELQLAKELREPAIAVRAELYRLWFKAYDKARPVSLGNSGFLKLGIDRRAKIQGLKVLEKLGMIRVEWRRRKSPLVSIVTF